jgi:ribose 5-phosphate isomerase B
MNVREKGAMRIAIAADSLDGVATVLRPELERRGHRVSGHGALADNDRADWAWCCAEAARQVACGAADQAVVACWTGTGASIAANKLTGVRAALCGDAVTAAGARQWNDANVLALSLRLVSPALLVEILDAWFATEASLDTEDQANLAQLRRWEDSPFGG